MKFAIIVLVALLPLAAGFDTLQYSADINGNGTIYSDTDGQTSRSSSYVQGGDYASGIKLDQSGQSESLFAGFAIENVTHWGSFKIVTKSGELAHTVSVTRSKDLMAQAVSGANSETFVSRYDVSGDGNLREMIIQAGTKGRPEYLRSVIGNGHWQLNESLKAGFMPIPTGTIFDANETMNITSAQGGA